MMSYQFFVPTRTVFGAGKLNELHTQKMPGKKAMVVISNGKSMKETGTLYRVLKELAYVGVETAVFDRVQANPLRSTVMEGAGLRKGKWLRLCRCPGRRQRDGRIEGHGCDGNQ